MSYETAVACVAQALKDLGAQGAIAEPMDHEGIAHAVIRALSKLNP